MTRGTIANPMPVTVLMTCHNRKDLTLASIAAIIRSAEAADVRWRITLIDDGSTDGTGEAVVARFPAVRIVRGDGNLFWNRGMLRAWRESLHDGSDFYLWLNDDLVVGEQAMADAFATWREAGRSKTICVGRTVDPDDGHTTYGVYARSPGSSRLRFRHLAAGEITGVTMNGNFVLIPHQATADVGLLEGVYTHSSGDVDYGLRASRAGYAIIEIARPVGRQARNVAFGEATTRMTLRQAYKVMSSPKGVPVREWLHFTRMHGGAAWPVNFVYRYIKMLARGTFGKRSS